MYILESETAAFLRVRAASLVLRDGPEEVIQMQRL